MPNRYGTFKKKRMPYFEKFLSLAYQEPSTPYSFCVRLPVYIQLPRNLPLMVF